MQFLAVQVRRSVFARPGYPSMRYSGQRACAPGARRSLSSKVVSQYSSLLSPMAVDCVLKVLDPARPELCAPSVRFRPDRFSACAHTARAMHGVVRWPAR